MTAAVQILEKVRQKLRLSPQEFAVASLYWAQVYGGGADEEEERVQSPPPQRESEPTSTPRTRQKGRSSIWNEEWEKLHLLRGIAGLNGGRLDRMKHACYGSCSLHPHPSS